MSIDKTRSGISNVASGGSYAPTGASLVLTCSPVPPPLKVGLKETFYYSQ